METRYSRKDFFRASFVKAGEGIARLLEEATGASAAVAVPPRPVFVRPPGALSEPRFLEVCTRCDDCVKACPHWVIRKAGPELGRRIGGTPILLPKENPCLMCDDLPCIAACTTGALKRPASGFAPIGRAVVSTAKCYMAQGQPCDYCVTICPERPRAIRLGEPGRPAEVAVEACTGCGKCAQLCPADAIEIGSR